VVNTNLQQYHDPANQVVHFTKNKSEAALILNHLAFLHFQNLLYHFQCFIYSFQHRINGYCRNLPAREGIHSVAGVLMMLLLPNNLLWM